MIFERYRDIAHHFSAKGFNFGSVFQQVAALLAHGPAGFESFISMTSGGGHGSDEARSKATRIARELDRILDGASPVRESVVRAASELRLSTRQVYNYLARYREERRVERLIDDLLRLHAVGYRMAEGRSLPDLLGSACFQFGGKHMSIARLSHRDRYQLFQQLTEGRSTPFGTRRSPAIAYWRHAAQAAPTWRGLITSFSDAVLPRPKAGPCSTTAGPHLADLVQAAARLHQKRQAL